MMTKHIEGLIAAPFTPMNENGSINTSIIGDYYRMLKHNSIKGVFINGSTGEGVSLTYEEKKTITESWVACAGSDPDFKIISLLGGNCVQDCISLANHAESCNLDAVAITSPFYFKPGSVKVLAEVCMEIANSIPDMPVYYYHIPVLTGVDFSMYALLQMIDGKTKNFAGIKYTHEDLMDFQNCIHYKNGKYDMLWGRDETMLSALPLGATAAVGSTFNYAAPVYHDLIRTFNERNIPAARALQQKSINMIELLGKYGGIATGKAYMKLIGLDCGGFRLPVKNMDAAQFEMFKTDVQNIGFEDFKSRLPGYFHD